MTTYSVAGKGSTSVKSTISLESVQYTMPSRLHASVHTSMDSLTPTPLSGKGGSVDKYTFTIAHACALL